MKKEFKKEDLDIVPVDPIWFLREIARRDGNLRLCSFVEPKCVLEISASGYSKSNFEYPDAELGFWHRFYSNEEEGEHLGIAIIEKLDGHIVELQTKYMKFINDSDFYEEEEDD